MLYTTVWQMFHPCHFFPFHLSVRSQLIKLREEVSASLFVVRYLCLFGKCWCFLSAVNFILKTTLQTLQDLFTLHNIKIKYNRYNLSKTSTLTIWRTRLISIDCYCNVPDLHIRSYLRWSEHIVLMISKKISREALKWL